MPYIYDILFIGVNNGINSASDLRLAEKDARDMSEVFRQLGLDGSSNERYQGKNVLLIGEKATRQAIEAELNRMRNLPQGDLLLIYWAGHLIKQESEYRFVVHETIDIDKLYTMIGLDDLIKAFVSASQRRNCVLILDTCHSGAAMQVLDQTIKRWEENDKTNTQHSFYLFAACDQNEHAREGTSNGMFTSALLKALRVMSRAKPELKPTLEAAVEDMNRSGGGFNQRANTSIRGSGSIELPSVTVTTTPVESGSHDPLEQALGYATQAFREYLNKNVVENVELIYFLSYDVWDGCLVYDGLIHGSIEQHLLRYVRRSFLDRDRLRSFYEEKKDTNELGAAGQCLREALNKVKDGRDSFEGLWYIGDLSDPYYNSEYRVYDRLLGLRSCLYIPVVGSYIPDVKGEDAHLRRPLGGILMAANRTPYGLIPCITEAKQGWEKASEQYRAAKSQDDRSKPIGEDWRISKDIVDHILPSLDSSEIHPFMKIIGGVYAQRATERCKLRRIMHPRFIKAVAREVKRPTSETHLGVIEIIGNKLEELREQRTDSNDPVLWANDLSGMIGVFDQAIMSNIVDRQARRDIIWPYLIACAWRDLRIEERKLRSQNSSDAAGRLESIGKKLEEPVPSGESGVTWTNYVKERSRSFKDDQMDAGNEPLASNSMMKFYHQQVDDLIDALREYNEEPSKFLLKPLREMAPLQEYLCGMVEIESLLKGTQQWHYLQRLSNSIQIWLLGVWVLQSLVSDHRGQGSQRALKNDVLGYMQKCVSEQSPDLRRKLRDAWSGEMGTEYLGLFWGLIAALHDVATPVQDFGEWCRTFFTRYFGSYALHSDTHYPVVLNIFHGPGFPFYKSAITSFYKSNERSWLEASFHLQLSKRVDHALAGALILLHEIEPDGEYRAQGIQKNLTNLMEQLCDNDKPEVGLVMPAYIAHAIAFSHLAQMKDHWNAIYKQGRNSEQPPYNRTASSQEYFATEAKNFVVGFEKFPLTYLLGLFEVLVEPSTGRPLGEKIHEPSNITHQVRGMNSFYVSKVDAHEGDPPRLCITLNLWEEKLEAEQALISSIKDMNVLKKEYIHDLTVQRTSRTYAEWRIYSRDMYKQQIEDSKTNIYNKQEGWATERQGTGGNEKLHMHVSQAAYDTMRMYIDLETFKESYKSEGWHFEVHFANVKSMIVLLY